jgi:hypothetical protein
LAKTPLGTRDFLGTWAGAIHKSEKGKTKTREGTESKKMKRKPEIEMKAI